MTSVHVGSGLFTSAPTSRPDVGRDGSDISYKVATIANISNVANVANAINVANVANV
ncbi:hypothetical protein [Sorangium sp. So ce513]|uniref:hypothetical protein n=1 Tax=Sorangium sp. So ce513 TaxID=3133315 RepID=UPI003F5E4DB0